MCIIILFYNNDKICSKIEKIIKEKNKIEDGKVSLVGKRSQA